MVEIEGQNVSGKIEKKSNVKILLENFNDVKHVAKMQPLQVPASKQPL